MWFLVVLSIGSATMRSHASEPECAYSFITQYSDAKNVLQAYCQSSVSKRRVWLVKDGHTLP